MLCDLVWTLIKTLDNGNVLHIRVQWYSLIGQIREYATPPVQAIILNQVLSNFDLLKLFSNT